MYMIKSKTLAKQQKKKNCGWHIKKKITILCYYVKQKLRKNQLIQDGGTPTSSDTVQQKQTWSRKTPGFGWATFRWASCIIVQQSSSLGS